MTWNRPTFGLNIAHYYFTNLDINYTGQEEDCV